LPAAAAKRAGLPEAFWDAVVGGDARFDAVALATKSLATKPHKKSVDKRPAGEETASAQKRGKVAEAEGEAPVKKVGRPKKIETEKIENAAPKKRGRPKAAAVDAAEGVDVSKKKVAKAAAEAAPKKKGRPSSGAEIVLLSHSGIAGVVEPAAVEAPVLEAAETEAPTGAEALPPKKVGPPSAASKAATAGFAAAAVAEPPKKRGRPAAAPAAKATDAPIPEALPPKKKKAGRPSNATKLTATAAAAAATAAAELRDGAAQTGTAAVLDVPKAALPLASPQRVPMASPSRVSALPMAVVSALVAADVALTCVMPNPKLAKSKSAARYDTYSSAKSAGGFISLGGKNADLQHDILKGFITLDGVEDWREHAVVVEMQKGV